MVRFHLSVFITAIKMEPVKVGTDGIDRWSGLNSRRACFVVRNLAEVFSRE